MQVYALTVDRLHDRALNYKNLQSIFINSNKSASKADRDLQRLQWLNNTLRGILCDLEMVASLLKGHALNTTIDVVAAHASIQLRSDKHSAEEGVDPVDINMVYNKLRKSLLNMRKSIEEKLPCVRNRKRTKKLRVKQGGTDDADDTSAQKTNRMRNK